MNVLGGIFLKSRKGPPLTTESGDCESSSRLQPYKALFVWGYNAARGIISREIIKFCLHKNMPNYNRYIISSYSYLL